MIAATDPTPGLPYIASASFDGAQMFAIVAAAIAAITQQDRAITGIRGLIRIPPETYLAVPTPPAPDRFAQAM